MNKKITRTLCLLAAFCVLASTACESKGASGDGAAVDTSGANSTAANSTGATNPAPMNGDTAAAVGSPPPASAGAAQPLRAGLRFDPSAMTNGQRLGDLTVAAVDVQRARAVPDSPYVGRVRFSGKTTLTGTLMKHPDADNKSLCFEADDESAARLPRMITDNRRAWMCFTNDAAAHEMARGLDAGRRVTVTIKNYVTTYSMSDAYNSAGLLKLDAVNKAP